MAKKAADQPSDASRSFEDALAEIEESVNAIEGGSLPLDEVVRRFKRCSTLIANCKDMLKDVQQQIEVLESKGK